MMRAVETTPAYWDQIIESKGETLRLDAWRKYMKGVYGKLVEIWFDRRESPVSVKTDLFEEACTRHSLLPNFGSGGIGFDHSLQIARSARRMMAKQVNGCRVLVCDLRNLPFLPSTIEQILSPSSLDHFKNVEEIDTALEEIARVLKPGGILILTMDNPQNPVVWIRNHLPFSWLSKIGLVPYYVGPTCSAKEARAKLQAAGMNVTHCTAVAHVPRAPAIWMVMLAEVLRSSRFSDWLANHFQKWEILQRLPFLFRTGYYIALRAVK